MQFKKVVSTAAASKYVAELIRQRLVAGEKVLWLVPGGSAIAVAVAVAHELWEQDVHNLKIALGDERFGAVEHPDSNWKQLEDAGFKFVNAQMVPVLNGQNIVATTEQYAANLHELFASTDYHIGLFGLGPDGHIAGILPGSPAIDAKEWAMSYPDAYERITITPEAIARLDEAVVYAVGDAKHAVLDELDKDLPLAQQPAQIFKKIPKVTIFNDYKGDKV